MNEEYICELCRRNGFYKLTEHHLIPRENGGRYKDTAWLCEDCHRQIHALFTNKELAVRLNTLELLENSEKIKRYLKYIKKQPPTKKVSIKKSKHVRRK